jgi:hypothetical protein
LNKPWGEFTPQWLPILSWRSIIVGLATAAVIAIEFRHPAAQEPGGQLLHP